MHKKRWQAVLKYIATGLNNFSIIGFGLGVFQKDVDCAFISAITFTVGILLTLGGPDGS